MSPISSATEANRWRKIDRLAAVIDIVALKGRDDIVWGARGAYINLPDVGKFIMHYLLIIMIAILL